MSDTDYKTKKIEGFEGPFINQYLPGMAIGPGKKIQDLEEAIGNNENEKLFRNYFIETRKFTLRFQRKLKESDPQNRFKNKEISWMKIINKETSKPEQTKKEVVHKKYTVTKKIKGDKAKKDEIYEIIMYGKKEYY